MAKLGLQSEGERIYITGPTFPLRAVIQQEAGGTFDDGRRQWWVPQGRRTDIERVIAHADEHVAAAVLDERVHGIASYQGQLYAVLYWGPTRGKSVGCRLVALGGGKPFWAGAGAVHWHRRFSAPVALRKLLEDERPANDARACDQCGQAPSVVSLCDDNARTAGLCRRCALEA